MLLLLDFSAAFRVCASMAQLPRIHSPLMFAPNFLQYSPPCSGIIFNTAPLIIKTNKSRASLVVVREREREKERDFFTDGAPLPHPRGSAWSLTFFSWHAHIHVKIHSDITPVPPIPLTPNAMLVQDRWRRGVIMMMLQVSAPC